MTLPPGVRSCQSVWELLGVGEGSAGQGQAGWLSRSGYWLGQGTPAAGRLLPTSSGVAPLSTHCRGGGGSQNEEAFQGAPAQSQTCVRPSHLSHCLTSLSLRVYPIPISRMRGDVAPVLIGKKRFPGHGHLFHSLGPFYSCWPHCYSCLRAFAHAISSA